VVIKNYENNNEKNIFIFFILIPVCVYAQDKEQNSSSILDTTDVKNRLIKFLNSSIYDVKKIKNTSSINDIVIIDDLIIDELQLPALKKKIQNTKFKTITLTDGDFCYKLLITKPFIIRDTTYLDEKNEEIRNLTFNYVGNIRNILMIFDKNKNFIKSYDMDYDW